MDQLLAALGDEVDDPDAETFDLFSNAAALPNLGMLDARADTLEVTVAGKDYVLTQSPGLLRSNRAEGTTGAAIWQTSVRLAGWLVAPDNLLFKHGVLDGQSVVLELGTGIAGLIVATLGPRVRTFIATDQPYLLKALRTNIAANTAVSSNSAPSNRRNPGKDGSSTSGIQVCSLDWENDDVQSVLVTQGCGEGVDLLIACDCIFNYDLIPPFVQTCADVCRLRARESDDSSAIQPSTMLLIAQQLRQSEVFEECLEALMRCFRLWRIPDERLSKDLQSNCGFVVHVAVLR